MGEYQTATNGFGISVQLEGDRAYLSKGNAGIEILKIPDLTPINAFDTPGKAWATAIAGNNLLVSDFHSLLKYELSTSAINSISNKDDSVQFFPAYPNPFKTQISLDYQLERRGAVEIALYSSCGQKLQTLFDGEKGPGKHTLSWSIDRANIAGLPSGLYLIGLETEAKRLFQKVILQR